MTVNAAEVLHASRLRAAALTGETAGYLVLLAAEASGQAGSGRGGDPTCIYLSEEGSLILEAGPGASLSEPESVLRCLLGELLACSPPSIPALGRVARGAPAGLPHLVAELETALIPVNRGAGRRALARLHRDVAKARALGKLAAPAPVPPQAPPEPARPVHLEVLAAPEPEPEPEPIPVDVASPVVMSPPLVETSALPELPGYEPEPTPFLGSMHLAFAPRPRPSGPPSEVAAPPSVPVPSPLPLAEPDTERIPEVANGSARPVSSPATVEASDALRVSPRPPSLPAPLPVRASQATAPVPSADPPSGYQPRRSDVTALLHGFAVAEERTLRELSRELKEIAGIAGTPCPPAVLPALAAPTGTSPSGRAR